MRSVKGALFIVLSFYLAACAGKPSRVTSEVNEKYKTFVAKQSYEPVDRITSFRFYSWSYLSEDYIILSTTMSKPHLIEFKTPCYDLRFSHKIKVNNTGSSLNANFDSIKILDSAFPSCYIKAIYPLTKEQAKELENLE
ncbi:DUF6491 family protein [Pleionea litopenaei]|uniref:DUF6491 family protein n=1 Tax=Pleionea litopenaei TaxID=3070815 RepID=A0AA51RWW8_9GAMM|nr:DUF6491 family protein [Pleionea sp. HL-JVS1]WMS89082.1 DUF6491 family protein [Pleionea sp. HL-JVS1]